MGAKAKPPVLLFVGAFARGAFHIPPLLDKIRVHRRDFSVEMFCNLDPSRDPEKRRGLYRMAARTTQHCPYRAGGAKRSGAPHAARRYSDGAEPMAKHPVSRLSKVWLRVYQAVITARAALHETAAGLPAWSMFPDADDLCACSSITTPLPQVLDALRQRDEAPDAVETHLRRQVDYFSATTINGPNAPSLGFPSSRN